MTSKDFSFAERADLDVELARKIARVGAWILRLFGYRGLDDPSKLTGEQTIYISNHGPALWGILDVLLVFDVWYNGAGKKTPIYGLSEDFVFDLPIIGKLAPKFGLRRPDADTIQRILDSGAPLVIPAGGNFDLFKPVWMRNIPILAQFLWRGDRSKIRHQNWYIPIAAKNNVPIQTMAFIGTSDMVPILWVSERLFVWLGFTRVRSLQSAPGYPITANHFVNIALFALLFPDAGLIGWVIFILLNIYFDPMITYPLALRRLKCAIGEPVEIDHNSVLDKSLRKAQAAQNEIVVRIMQDLNRLLHNAEIERRDVYNWIARNVPGREFIRTRIFQPLQVHYLARYGFDRDMFL